MASGKSSSSEEREFDAQVRARQRNTIWPDTLRGDYDVDSFVFSRTARATPLQRIGIAIFAFIFLMPAIPLVYFAFTEDLPTLARAFLLLLAVPFALLGLRLVRNACRRH